MVDRLKDKIAIVTGGACGIGEASALLLAEEGASVVVADMDEDGGQTTVAQIEKNGGRAVFVRADISRDEDARAIIDHAVAAFGQIDVLVNNAAVFVVMGLEAEVADWQRSLNVNVIGTARVSHYAAEKMKLRKRGAIVNLGSISSFIAQPSFITYSTTKAAILQMTRNMAMDLAPFDIRVNCVCPGVILTRATREHMERTGVSLPDFLKVVEPQHLLNRVGKPREVAQAILFLASDEASFITGTHLMVDGGYTAQ